MPTHVLNLPAGASALWQNRLGLLLESTGEGRVRHRPRGNCVFINRAGAQMLGFSAEEVMGRNMHALTTTVTLTAASTPTATAHLQRLPPGPALPGDTEVFWRQDGSAFAVEYSSHPILEGEQVHGAVIAFVDITSRKRAADELQRAHDDLARANDELERRVARTRSCRRRWRSCASCPPTQKQVREDERTRIAREVHDELGSLLVALKMDVNWLHKRLGERGERTPRPRDMRRMRCKCQNMSRLIENAVDNVGRIITDLRPSILDHQGLWAALEWQAQEFVQSAELELAWHMEVPPPAPARARRHGVFRIFQEMLNVMGRHAQASAIDIAIDVQDEMLQLRARRRRGRHPPGLEAPTAYGVMGMRRRARQLGASASPAKPGAGLVPAIADSSGAVMNPRGSRIDRDDHRIVQEGSSRCWATRQRHARITVVAEATRAARCWSRWRRCRGARKHLGRGAAGHRHAGHGWPGSAAGAAQGLARLPVLMLSTYPEQRQYAVPEMGAASYLHKAPIPTTWWPPCIKGGCGRALPVRPPRKAWRGAVERTGVRADTRPPDGRALYRGHQVFPPAHGRAEREAVVQPQARAQHGEHLPRPHPRKDRARNGVELALLARDAPAE